MGGKSSKPLGFYHILNDEQSEFLFNVFRKRERFGDAGFDIDKGKEIHNNTIRLIIVIFIILLFFSILFKIRKK